MAGYQRMVSYLYEYHQGEKGNNVGYAKLEIREDIAKMIVSIRLRRDVTDTCPVGFYYREGRRAYRIPVGEIKFSGGRVQERLLLPGAKAGESGLPVTQMNGILIFLPDGLIGSAWDEQGVPSETDVLKTSRHTGTERSGELWAAELSAEEQIPSEETGSETISETILESRSEASSELLSEKELSGEKELSKESVSGENLKMGRPSMEYMGTEYSQETAPRTESPQTEFSQTEPSQTESSQTGFSQMEYPQNRYEPLNDIQREYTGEHVSRTEMTEIPITEPRAENHYRNEAWMEETERAGEAAQVRRQERADQIRQSEEREREEPIIPEEQGTERNRRGFPGVERQEATNTDQENSIEYFFQQGTRMCPFEDEAITSCVRIEPADLEYFPKETWILGSNSFLLHGYYTYGHLILAKMKGMGRESLIIGVPGLYQNRERFLARLFGFEYFKPISKTGAGEGDFGYWYLFLPDMEG